MSLIAELPFPPEPHVTIALRDLKPVRAYGRNSHTIDAIYIPCRSRHEQLAVNLGELARLGSAIYLLPSPDTEFPFELGTAKVIQYWKSPASELVLSFATCKADDLRPLQSWDLPLKRNLAVLHAASAAFTNILLLDDDIGGLTLDTLAAASNALSDHPMAGCKIGGFPDTSVTGHLFDLAGDPCTPFLSGSCLFLDVTRESAHFPLIYNEDWLAICFALLNGGVGELGEVRQAPYSPFTLERIRMQEFGEIIAEGMFQLLANRRVESWSSREFWRHFLRHRQGELKQLLQYASLRAHTDLIHETLRLHETISAENCTAFLDAWFQDVAKFNQLKSHAHQTDLFTHD